MHLKLNALDSAHARPHSDAKKQLLCFVQIQNCLVSAHFTATSSRVFSTRAPLTAPLFVELLSFLQMRNTGGRGDIHSSKANVWPLSLAPLSHLALPSLLLLTIHQPQVTSHILCIFLRLDTPPHSRISNSCIFLRLDTPRGRGVGLPGSDAWCTLPKSR